MNFISGSDLKGATKKAIRICKEKNKVPIKVSFHNLKYEVDADLSVEEQEIRTNLGLPSGKTIRK